MLFTKTWLTVLTPERWTFSSWCMQTERMRMVRGREQGWLNVLMIDCVNLTTSLFKKNTAVRTMSCYPLASGLTIYRGNSCMLLESSVSDADAVCDVIHSAINRLHTQHLHALLISVAFNYASFNRASTQHTFIQYVTWFTRDYKIFNLFYANTMEAFNSSPLRPLGRPGHDLVHLCLCTNLSHAGSQPSYAQ